MSLPDPLPPRAGHWFEGGRWEGRGRPSPVESAVDPDAGLAADLRREVVHQDAAWRLLEARAWRQALAAERAGAPTAPAPVHPTVAATGTVAFWSPVPIPGFRTWRVTRLGMRGVVQPWPWPRLEARCPRGDAAPHDTSICRCGIYALKQAAAFRATDLNPRRGVAYGLVALSGKVVEHEHGYRAQRAEVLAVVLVHEGAAACGAHPGWIEWLFSPDRGEVEIPQPGSIQAVGPGLPAAGARFLEDQARRFREAWT